MYVYKYFGQMIGEKYQEGDLRAIFVGEAGVGKTSILSYFVHRSFRENEKTTISPTHSRVVMRTPYGDAALLMCDTAGTEKYQSVIPMLSRNADGIILVFDLTDSHSFDNCLNWLEVASRSNSKDPVVLLLGNKLDMVNEYDHQLYKDFADEHHMIFYATSAKTGENIVEAIQELTDKLAQKYMTNNRAITEPGVALEASGEGDQSCC